MPDALIEREVSRSLHPRDVVQGQHQRDVARYRHRGGSRKPHGIDATKQDVETGPTR
jgi:hypothetical protein